jgi:hypothetical protein
MDIFRMDFQPDFLRFRQIRCTDGYAVRRIEFDPEDVFQPEPDGRQEEALEIVPLSNQFEPVEFRDPPAPLHLALAEAEQTPQAIAEFMVQFGGLFGKGRTFVSTALDFQSRLLKFLNLTGSAQDVAAGFDAAFGENQFRIEVGAVGRSALRYFVVPKNLANFIILQAAQQVSGVEWRKCANPKCGIYYPVSIGRGAIVKKGAGKSNKNTCGQAKCIKAVQRLKKEMK